MASEAAIGVLTSPIILFFLLGALAGLARSDLSVPEPIGKAMALYLMAAIGLKGGVQVAEAGFSDGLLHALAAGIVLSLALPFLAYAVLRAVGRLNRINASAVAAHYGSVSVVTFVTASEVLTAAAIPPAGYMVAVMAVMETPAIIVGLWLARGAIDKSKPRHKVDLWHETFLNGSVVLLMGSFLIGLAAGKSGVVSISPFFEAGFQGVLCLFLLDMGLIAARRLRETRNLTWLMVALGVFMPAVHGIIGTVLGSAIGLDIGSAAALGVLAASASYIAVPAVMRVSLPEADPGISLGMVLAVTFPFNVTLGIPLCIAIATRMGS